MPDFTDLQLVEMEKELNKIYKQAQKEIKAKWDAYMVKAQAKVDAAQAAYQQSLLAPSFDPLAAADLKAKYEKAMLNMTLQNAHYQEMVNQVTDKLADTNQIALNYLNGEMPKVYCHNYNLLGDENISGYSFELVNEDAVKNIIKNGNTSLLPQKTLNIPKDKQWNTKNINSQVLQGILQGESIPKIADRLQNVTDMNRKSAIRNARTMTTGAENKGKQDSFVKATNDGVIMKRRWVVAHDERLRDWHAALDGVEVDVDKPFENDYGEIMYPGDPTAHPANVYNCRCALRGVIKGFKPKEQTASAYASQYQGTSVTAQYYSMLDEDKALGNEFWKALNAEGKPSQIWKDYLAGNTSSEVTKKLDDIVAKYKGTGKPVKPVSAKKAAAMSAPPPPPKPNLDMYQDKSMTATFYSVKAEDSALGKEFWSVLQAEDNPSAVWSQYLTGIAPKEVTEKLDKILLQHKGTGAWTKPVKMTIKTEYADIDDPHTLNHDVYTVFKKAYLDDVDFEGDLEEYWMKYKAGSIENSELDKIFKGKKTKAAAKVVDNVDDLDDLAKAKADLAVAQGNIDSLGKKVYSGIWKEDYTLADYESKSGTIAAKKVWYQEEIDKYKSDPTYKSALYTEAEKKAKIVQFEQYIDDLDEFETKGKLYVQYSADYKAAADKVKKLTPVGDTFGPDVYTQERKNGAKWFTRSTYSDGDRYYTQTMGGVHKNRTKAEYDAYRDYTSASGPFNRPLAGFNAYSGSGSSGWSEKNYVGPGKVSIDNEGKGKKIKDLTSLIEKSTTRDDIWIQTAQNLATLEGKQGFLGVDYGTLANMTDKELQKFVGTTSEFTQFISGSINRGGGSYTPGDMRINIYVPQGSEALYVLEDSTFGKAEHEIILQRGGTYRITKMYWGQDVEKGGRKLIVDMDLLTGYGYNKFE